MSSILEALKKAESQSAADRGSDTPWPAPPPQQQPNRQLMRRRWLMLGMAAGLCIAGLIFWKTRAVDTSLPDAPVKAAPVPRITRQPVPSLTTDASKSALPAAKSDSVEPPEEEAPVSLQTEALKSPVGSRQAIMPAPPARRPSSTVLQNRSPVVQPPSPFGSERRQAAVSPTNDSGSDLQAASPATAETAAAAPQIVKNYKNDPRIDLQALVWGEESDKRFVVINNRLVKEGGSVDKIVVVKINPDDVLLAEGAERWHEEFKIR